MTDKSKERPSAREIQAMAYALVDEAETRAEYILERNPALTWRAALNIALDHMARGK